MINLPSGTNTNAPIAFKEGSVIFGEGENSKFLVIVKKGAIRLIKSKGQHLNILKVCKEKEILNEVSILTNKPTAFAAIAKTDVELVLIEKKDIEKVLKNGPGWINAIFETLCERLISTQEIIDEHNLQSGEKEVEMLLNKDDEAKCLNALLTYKSTQGKL